MQRLVCLCRGQAHRGAPELPARTRHGGPEDGVSLRAIGGTAPCFQASSPRNCGRRIFCCWPPPGAWPSATAALGDESANCGAILVLHPGRDHFAEKRAGLCGRWGGPVTGVGNQSSGQCVWEEYLNRIRNGKEERGRKRRHKALQRETLGQRPVTAGLGPVSVTAGESHPLLWWMGALRARIPCLAGCGSTEKNAGPVRNSDNIMTRRYVICTFA